jgi:hypothetical protein
MAVWGLGAGVTPRDFLGAVPNWTRWQPNVSAGYTYSSRLQFTSSFLLNGRALTAGAATSTPPHRLRAVEIVTRYSHRRLEPQISDTR